MCKREMSPFSTTAVRHGVMTWSISPTEGLLRFTAYLIVLAPFGKCARSAPAVRLYLPFIESAPAVRPRFPLLESAPVVRLQCARTFGRYISRSFVDDPFQGSKYLSHHPTFLGEASRQLTPFAPPVHPSRHPLPLS